MRCGGDADVSIEYIDAKNPDSFIEEFDKRAVVFIFGAGHVGQALEPILRYVSFTTKVIDDPAGFCKPRAVSRCGMKLSSSTAFWMLIRGWKQMKAAILSL